MILREKDELWKDLYDFPQNKTLYIDQFTVDGPLSDEDRKRHQCADMNDLFEKFKPFCNIELLNEEGEFVPERFAFNSIDDFDDERLIENSPFLEEKQHAIEIYQGIIHQLEKNKALRSTLDDNNTRLELEKFLDVLANELSNGAENKETHFGFRLFKGIINGIENLDPRYPAQKAIYLTSNDFKGSRQQLIKVIGFWRDVLKDCDTHLDKAIEECAKRCADLEQNLQNNLCSIHEETRNLEITYRTIDSFFAQLGENDCSVTVMNVSKRDLESSNSETETIIQKELKDAYDRIDLTDRSYSLLVIPGYLGSATTIRRWAKMANQNRVLLITDFKDVADFISLRNELDSAKLQDQDVELSNVVMTCNYILGRKRSELADENDDLYFPASGALAGRMANTEVINISQGVVGKEYGNLDGLYGTRINFLQSDVAVLVEKGVIPIVEEDGHVFAYSNRTLYNGASTSLQEYPIVRVFDWIKKVLMGYMHDISLENWDPYKSSQSLKDKIQGFLSHYQGYQHLFSDYRLGEPVQNPQNKEVTVSLSIIPYYVGKTTLLKLKADKTKKVSIDTEFEKP